MKYSLRTILISAAAVLALASCTKEPDAEPSSVHQSRSLDAWIKLHKPELVGNRQPEGYYVEILDEGASLGEDVKPLGEAESSWIGFDMTVRTLTGRVCVTRDAALAKQEASFTKYTHYVPMFRYCGETNYTMLEGTYYALRNELTTGEETYRARIGSKLRLYLPASIAYSSSGASDTGGYGGQYSLDGGKPAMIDIFVRDTVANPLQREGVDVDYFAEHNGALRPLPETDDDKTDAQADGDGEEDEDEDDSMYAWRNAVDTIPQLYINRRYVPTADRPSFDYRTGHITPYSGYEPYDNLAELDKKINAALIERFGDPAELTQGEEKIGTETTVRIWYICRFLDGFVIDTNIDEVKRLVYDEVASSGSSISYSADTDRSNYIAAWYYAIPQLRKGQWAGILTTSTNAYGATGQAGGSTSSSSGSSSYYDYLNYYNYMNYYNNYYGGYYGGYYGNYYNSYYGGYYGNYLYDTSDSTTTKTTYSTEILPYTPLLFQIFIEEEN